MNRGQLRQHFAHTKRYTGDQELRLSGTGLAAWMATNKITTALLPTPLAELFLKDMAALPADVCSMSCGQF